jgi:hypothetical protein
VIPAPVWKVGSITMAETEATLAEQLAEIRAQLAWVRDYL